MDLLPKEQAALDVLCAWVRRRFGDRVRALALFGSRARGEGHEHSDLDVLVVVDDLERSEGRELDAVVGDILTDHGVLVSAFLLSTAHYDQLRRRERRIIAEIDRDGVPL